MSCNHNRGDEERGPYLTDVQKVKFINMMTDCMWKVWVQKEQQMPARFQAWVIKKRVGPETMIKERSNLKKMETWYFIF